MAAVLGIAGFGLAQGGANDAQRQFTTHDYTTTAGSPTNLREVWADVKSPGARYAADARTYLVGTAQVQTTALGATYSGASIEVRPIGWPTFTLNGTDTRQVVVLQCRSATESIVWQRFFYGDSGEEERRITNARAIAVWPAATEAETRIAISGETCDETLPLSQLAGPLASATATDPTGFVAVYDGTGALRWTYQFYGSDWSQRCAITDLSIRVEQVEGQTYDVVTYCGISSHGVPSAATPLSPQLPFAAPTATTVGYVPAAGNSNHGGSQWDGIVGRLRHARTTSTTTQQFHSIVGGAEQDGLFGLAEATADHFVVVGESRRTGAGTMPLAYPFTDGVTATPAWNSLAFAVGVVSVFDASGCDGGGPLVMEASHNLGRAGEWESFALDVSVTRYLSSTYTVQVVGGSDDWTNATQNLVYSSPSSYCCPTVTSPHVGGLDGFLMYGALTPGSGLSWALGTFYGTDGRDHFAGVATWNEWHNRCVAFGSTDAGGQQDLAVVSFSVTTAVRSDRIGSSSSEFPAALGAAHATALAPLTYPTAIGSPSGGGVAMDMRSRVAIVGGSPSASSGSPFPTVGGLAPLGDFDGVRSSYDMLPLGVWRTDGTGTRAAVHGIVPQPSGYDGGTTPAPCIGAFGQQIGAAVPTLSRFGIDYWGGAPAPTVTSGGVFFEANHTDPNFSIVAAMIDIGAPAAPTISPLANIEVWLGLNPVTLSQPLTQVPTYGWQLWPVAPGMPAGNWEFMTQVVVLLSSTLPCDSGASLALAASPGLVLSY